MKQPIITTTEMREILAGLLRDRYERELAQLIRDVLLEDFSYDATKEEWAYKYPLWKINFCSEQLDGIQLGDVDAFVQRIQNVCHRFIEQQIQKRLQPAGTALTPA